MSKTVQNFQRFTISLPAQFSEELEKIRKELNLSQSEFFKLAVEKFSTDYQRQKLKQACELMQEEYRHNLELTAFTVLDGEEFI